MVGAALSSTDPKSAALAVAGVSAVFALKHYVADFILQTNWIARGKERQTGWLTPLLAHALCHGAMTLAVTFVLAPRLWWLALVDFLVHFIVDRGKTRMSSHGRWKPDQAQFWWLLGFDQLLHQLTNIALALTIVLF